MVVNTDVILRVVSIGLSVEKVGVVEVRIGVVIGVGWLVVVKFRDVKLGLNCTSQGVVVSVLVVVGIISRTKIIKINKI